MKNINKEYKNFTFFCFVMFHFAFLSFSLLLKPNYKYVLLLFIVILFCCCIYLSKRKSVLFFKGKKFEFFFAGFYFYFLFWLSIPIGLSLLPSSTHLNGLMLLVHFYGFSPGYPTLLGLYWLLGLTNSTGYSTLWDFYCEPDFTGFLFLSLGLCPSL